MKQGSIFYAYKLGVYTPKKFNGRVGAVRIFDVIVYSLIIAIIKICFLTARCNFIGEYAPEFVIN
jgi:hypothetical protein